jgi:hypothetical protein
MTILSKSLVGLALAGGFLLTPLAAYAESYAACVKGCKEDQALCHKVCEDKVKIPMGKQKCKEACDEVALNECIDDCKEEHRR